MQRPFLIHTLRRTGGTSLTSFMDQISDHDTMQHEPFNRERVWGRITADVQGGLPRALLRERLQQLLVRRPNIKHCVEVVPMAITQALIPLCAELGYAQFVLHRRQEKDRLMSLYMAQATGAWGARDAAEIYPRLRRGEVRPAPIDLGRVAERVRLDAAALGETLMRLRAAGVDFGWLIFEEIYADPEATRQAACAVAARMGISVAPDDPRLGSFARQEGQGSGQALDLVPEAPALARLLDDLLG